MVIVFEVAMRLFDLLQKESGVRESINALKENYNNYVGDVYMEIENACKEAKNRSYSLSLTGYSIGGWLAQIGGFFCLDSFKFSKVKIVAFDSPGCK